MSTILLVRHAQASFGAENYDVLSERGRRQARTLSSALADRGVRTTRPISGPARRQIDTANLCCPLFADHELTIDPRWAEYPTDDVLETHGSTPMRLGYAGPTDTTPPSSKQFQLILDQAIEKWIEEGPASGKRESWPGFVRRVSAAFGDLVAAARKGETAIVFSSAGAIAAVCSSLLGDPAATFIALNRVQVNTGITKIVHGARGSSLISFNDHVHLEVAGPDLITYR